MNNITKERQFAGAWLPMGLMQEVRIFCAKKEMKIQDFIEQAIREGLKCKKK